VVGQRGQWPHLSQHHHDGYMVLRSGRDDAARRPSNYRSMRRTRGSIPRRLRGVLRQCRMSCRAPGRAQWGEMAMTSQYKQNQQEVQEIASDPQSTEWEDDPQGVAGGVDTASGAV
jgi:hypothetical protein